MRARNLILTAALCFVGTAVCFADNPNMGTWKLDAAKSKIPAGLPMNTTVVYEAAGDQIKVTTDGTDKDGKVVLTGHIMVSADGKTRTLHATATDANGKKITGTQVFDKQ